MNFFNDLPYDKLSLTNLKLDCLAKGNNSDDTKAIKQAITNKKSTIYFPSGVYVISENIEFPNYMTLKFEDGAILAPNTGITITINCFIDAGLYQIFGGKGSIIGTIKNDFVSPQWWGASGSSKTLVANITSGSNVIQTSNSLDFKVGQDLLILNGGSPVTLNTSSLLPSIVVAGTTGTTRYDYVVVALTKKGGTSAPSLVATTTTGNSALTGTNYNTISWAAVTGADGYAVYGLNSNPSSSIGLLALLNSTNRTWNDFGVGSLSTSPWLPTGAPSVSTNENLQATITAVNSNNIVISTNCLNTYANTTIYHEDSGAINRCVQYVNARGGGKIDFSGYYVLYPDPLTGKTITINSNILFRSRDKAVIKRFHNPAAPWPGTQSTFCTPDVGADNWSFVGLVFDGGTQKNAYEFECFGIVTKGNCSNFEISDCEFRYQRGKAIYLTQSTNTNFNIIKNYFHHCNSNAIGLAGENFLIGNNRMDTCLLTQSTGSNNSNAESILASGTAKYGNINNNIITNWSQISFTSNSLNIQISKNFIRTGYGDHGSGISFSGIANNITICDNTIDVRGTTSTNGIIFDALSKANGDIKNIVIQNNIIYSDGNGNRSILFYCDSPNLGRISKVNCSNNYVYAYSATLEPILFKYCQNVTFNSNIVESDIVTASGIAFIGGNNSLLTGNIASGITITLNTNCVANSNTFGSIISSATCNINGNIFVAGGYGISPSAGVIDIRGAGCIVSNNQIDINSLSNIPAINEKTGVGVDNSLIKGNNIINYANVSSSRRIVSVGVNSVITENIGYNSRLYEKSATPTLGTWNIGDKVYSSTPAPSGNVGWVCTTKGTANSTSWVATTAYNVNDTVNANNKVYICTVAGTSGATAPSHSSGSATNGTATFQYVDVLAVFKTFGTISA